MAEAEQQLGAAQNSVWDCRTFDLEAYQSDLLAKRSDQFSCVYAVTFLTAPADDSGQDLDAMTDADKQPVCTGTQTVLAAAYSTGIVRLFALKQAIKGWTNTREPAPPALTWQAHAGPVLCCAVLGAGPGALLLTGGVDGSVAAWRVQDLIAAAAAAAPPRAKPSWAPQAGALVEGLQPTAVVRVTPAGLQPGWGASTCPAASPVTCLGVDGEVVYAGTADGAVHELRIGAAAAAGTSVVGRHQRGVVAVDTAPAAGLLATGGEDGVARLWDVRAHRPAAAIVVGQAAPGTHVGLQSLSRLPAAPDAPPRPRTAQAVTALRFAGTEGCWLHIGCGGASPALLTWSLEAGMAAARTPLPCSPQVLGSLPGEVLVAGTARKLYRYNFSGGLSCSHALPAQMSSVVALSVLPHEHTDVAGAQPSVVAPGAVAMGGTYGCVDVLSSHGTRLMTSHMADDDIEAGPL